MIICSKCRKNWLKQHSSIMLYGNYKTQKLELKTLKYLLDKLFRIDKQ